MKSTRLITGQPLDYFRDWLEHPTRNDPHWQPVDFRRTFADIKVPMHLITGWYDLFTRYQLEDYQLLKAAGHRPYLTVGPTCHTSLSNFGRDHAGRPGLVRRLSQERSQPLATASRAHFCHGQPAMARAGRFSAAVRRRRAISCTAIGSWRSISRRRMSAPDRYIYDPSNPTPALADRCCPLPPGPCDQRALESRSDVITYHDRSIAERCRSDRPSARRAVCPIDVWRTPTSWRVCATC